MLDPSGRFTATSRGLALPVYRKLNEAAREAGIPLVGHAPVNLGLDALLETRQDLAHSGALSNIYFLPLASNPSRLVLTGAAFSTLQTTLINYELLSGPERLALIQEPAMEYLDETIRTRWRRLPQTGSPGYAYHRFMKKLVGALHRAGVPLVAGTDVMGVPLLSLESFYRELQLLTESGPHPVRSDSRGDGQSGARNENSARWRREDGPTSFSLLVIRFRTWRV